MEVASAGLREALSSPPLPHALLSNFAARARSVRPCFWQWYPGSPIRHCPLFGDQCACEKKKGGHGVLGKRERVEERQETKKLERACVMSAIIVRVQTRIGQARVSLDSTDTLATLAGKLQKELPALPQFKLSRDPGHKVDIFP